MSESARDALVERLFEAVLGFSDIYAVYLGERLGLYGALRAGPATAVELARATGLNEQYVRRVARAPGGRRHPGRRERRHPGRRERRRKPGRAAVRPPARPRRRADQSGQPGVHGRVRADDGRHRATPPAGPGGVPGRRRRPVRRVPARLRRRPGGDGQGAVRQPPRLRLAARDSRRRRAVARGGPRGRRRVRLRLVEHRARTRVPGADRGRVRPRPLALLPSDAARGSIRTTLRRPGAMGGREARKERRIAATSAAGRLDASFCESSGQLDPPEPVAFLRADAP